MVPNLKEKTFGNVYEDCSYKLGALDILPVKKHKHTYSNYEILTIYSAM